MEKYSFKCDCIACEKSYPLQKNLKVVDVLAYNDITAQKPKSGSKGKGIEFTDNFCDYINLHYEKNFPCKELVEMMEKNKKCYDGK